MKKITNNFLKFLSKAAFVISASTFSYVYTQSITVLHLSSPRQPRNSNLCAQYAANSADCMVSGQNLDGVKKLLAQGFDKKIVHERQNLNGTDLQNEIFPKLNHPERITIIDRPEHFNAIKLNTAVPPSLLQGIENFQKNGIPHAIAYNEGGHWVAFGIIKEKGQTIILRTDSCKPYEQSYTAPKKSIEYTLYLWFMGQKILIPGEIIQEIDGINRRLFAEGKDIDGKPLINFSIAKNHLYKLFNQIILLDLQNNNSYKQMLKNNFDTTQKTIAQSKDTIKENFDNYFKNISDNIEKFKNYAQLYLYSNYKLVNITNNNAPEILKIIADNFNPTFSFQIFASTGNFSQNPFCRKYAYQILTNIIQNKKQNTNINLEGKEKEVEIFIEKKPDKKNKNDMQPKITTKKENGFDQDIILQIKPIVEQKIAEFYRAKNFNDAQKIMDGIITQLGNFNLWGAYAKEFKGIKNKLTELKRNKVEAAAKKKMPTRIRKTEFAEANNNRVRPTKIPIRPRSEKSIKNTEKCNLPNPFKKASETDKDRILTLLNQNRFLKIYTILSKYFHCNELNEVLSKNKIQNSTPTEIKTIIKNLLTKLEK